MVNNDYGLLDLFVRLMGCDLLFLVLRWKHVMPIFTLVVM